MPPSKRIPKNSYKPFSKNSDREQAHSAASGEEQLSALQSKDLMLPREDVPSPHAHASQSSGMTPMYLTKILPEATTIEATVNGSLLPQVILESKNTMDLDFRSLDKSQRGKIGIHECLQLGSVGQTCLRWIYIPNRTLVNH
eukprot:Gb_07211 [translate_table: standard]